MVTRSNIVEGSKCIKPPGKEKGTKPGTIEPVWFPERMTGTIWVGLVVKGVERVGTPGTAGRPPVALASEGIGRPLVKKR